MKSKRGWLLFALVAVLVPALLITISHAQRFSLNPAKLTIPAATTEAANLSQALSGSPNLHSTVSVTPQGLRDIKPLTPYTDSLSASPPSGSSVGQGQLITYTITITNGATADTTSGNGFIRVFDTSTTQTAFQFNPAFPTGVMTQPGAGSAWGPCTITPNGNGTNQFTCYAGDGIGGGADTFAANQTVVLKVDALVLNTATPDAVLNNTSFFEKDADGNGVDEVFIGSNTVSHIVAPSVDLAISKFSQTAAAPAPDPQGSVIAGGASVPMSVLGNLGNEGRGNITYVLNLSNTGPANATNVLIQDALPGGPATLDNNPAPPSSANFPVAGPVPGKPIIQSALGVTSVFVASDASVPPVGNATSFAIGCHNFAIGSTMICTPGNNTAINPAFAPGVMPAGFQARIAYRIQVGSSAPPGSIVTNSAQIASIGAVDINAGNNTSLPTQNAVITKADLGITKVTSNATPVAGGAAFSYTLVVTNNGPSDARNIVVTDPLPPAVIFQNVAVVNNPSVPGTGLTCSGPPNATNGTVTCTGNLPGPAGMAVSTSTITIVAQIVADVASGVRTNTATVSSDTPEPSPNVAPNAASVQQNITVNAPLSISKAGPATACPGDLITYHVTVNNGGSSTAINATISDPLPANTTFVSVEGTNGFNSTCSFNGGSPGTVTCPAVDIPTGQSTVDITVRVGAAAPNGNLSNTATITTAGTGSIAVGTSTTTAQIGPCVGTLQFSAPTFSVNENTPLASITVTRTGNNAGPVTVNFATSNGTATSALDYGNTAGTLTFDPGVITQSFFVPILDDAISEGTESVNLTLSGPTGGAVLGSQNTAQLLIVDNEPPPPNSINVYAVTVNNNLLTLNSAAPTVILSNVPITGLQAGEQIVGIDFRPANGLLYALGTSSRIYRVNTTTGVATAVGAPFSPFLSGIDFGSDFNPTVDRLRVVSDSDQNLRLNPDTGTVVGTDTALNYAVGDPNFGSNPNIVGAAYTNSFAGASSLTTTTLYGIDSNLDVLVRQGGVEGAAPSPNTGQLTTIGPLGVNPTGLVGFDIQGSNNRAFAAFNTPGDNSKLYTINLTTGAATLLGNIGGSELIRDIAVAAGTFQFSATVTSVGEGAGKATLTVTRTGNTSIPASVNFTTTDDSAIQKSDYIIGLGTVNFAAGDVSKTFDIFIVDDGFVEPAEGFHVTLSAPTNDFAVSGTNAIEVDIFDNDAVTTNPIDITSFFVRQHYLDFFNREPDASGLAFWTNEINICAGNPACIATKRQNVSASFFLSIEFQETGGTVLRTQRAAFGRRSSSVPLRVPYVQFMRDARQVGNGVIVGQAGAQAVLEANKQAYAEQIANSPAFVLAYPLAQTATQFVDALFASAGVVPTTAERNAAIAAFGGGGTAGRVAALRSVSDSNSLRQAEMNPAFVLMEYYGYLRRNPDDPPDGNDAGYQFWLTKLNAFNGNFEMADMVKAFLTSGEYRSRFGTP